MTRGGNGLFILSADSSPGKRKPSMSFEKRATRNMAPSLSDCTLEGRASTSAMTVGMVPTSDVMPTVPTSIIIPVGPGQLQVPTNVGNPDAWGLPPFYGPGLTPDSGDLLELPGERPPDAPPPPPTV